MHLRGVFANKLESFLQGDLLNCGHLVRVRHALNASRFFHDFWTESRGDELRLIVRLTFDHVRHGGAVLRVERGVDKWGTDAKKGTAAINGLRNASGPLAKQDGRRNFCVGISKSSISLSLSSS